MNLWTIGLAAALVALACLAFVVCTRRRRKVADPSKIYPLW